MKKKTILIFILFLGLFLRIYKLNNVPLYGDELTLVLDSKSIIENRTDQLGNFLPITFPMRGGTPFGYVYLSIPFMLLTNNPVVGIRLLSVMSGVLQILVVYLLVGKLVDRKIALVSSFLLAVSPWSLSVSKYGFESNFALLLMLLGFYFFYEAVYEKKIFLIPASICWGLTIHTYQTYKLTLFLFLTLIFFFYAKLFLKKTLFLSKSFFISVVILMVFGGLALSQIFTNKSEERFLSLSIFSNQEISQKILQEVNNDRNLFKQTTLLNKIFINRPMYYFKYWLNNYALNFSVNYLFVNGDGNPRHNMAGFGTMYWVELATIFVGIIVFLQKKIRMTVFLLLWVVIVPLATSIVGVPHTLRNLFMFTPLLVFSAIGLVKIFESKNVYLTTIIVFLFIGQFVMVMYNLFFLSPIKYLQFWSNNARLTTDLINNQKNKYRKIYVSSEIDNIEYAYPVYSKISASEVIKQNNTTCVEGKIRCKKYGNVYILFSSSKNILKNNEIDLNTLLVDQ